MKRTKSVKP